MNRVEIFVGTFESFRNLPVSQRSNTIFVISNNTSYLWFWHTRGQKEPNVLRVAKMLYPDLRAFKERVLEVAINMPQDKWGTDGFDKLTEVPAETLTEA